MPLRVSCPGPVPRVVCFWGGGGRPGPVSPLPGLGLCALRGVGLRVWGVPAPGGGVGWGGGAPVRRAPRLCGRGGQWGGGSPCLGPSLCLPWAGNKAGVLGVPLAMEGVAPIPLRFVLACCPRTRSVWRPGVLARVRLAFVVPAGARGWGVGAGPAPASLSGAAVLLGGGGIIPCASGGVGAGAPVACGPLGGGGGHGGGSRRGSPPLSLGGGGLRLPAQPPFSSPAHSPLVYAFGRGRGVAPGAGCRLPPAGQPGGGGGGRPVKRPPGGSNRPGPSLCPPWAGNIAGSLAMLRSCGARPPYSSGSSSRAAPGSGPCVVLARWCWFARRLRPPREQAMGGAGACGVRIQLRPPPPPGRHGPFWGRGDVPSAPGGAEGRRPRGPQAGGGAGGRGEGRLDMGSVMISRVWRHQRQRWTFKPLGHQG